MRVSKHQKNGLFRAVISILIAGGAFWRPVPVLGQSTPQINAGGIVNSANYGPLIAPGAIFSIFGSGLATTAGGISSTPYPYTINGTTVTVNGVQVPLLYVSPGVINAQMPVDVPQNSPVDVVVTAGSVSSSPVQVSVTPVAPAMFTKDGTGRNEIAARHLDSTEISASKPAQPGEVIVLFGTGLGATTPALPTNTPPTTGTPAAETPVVTIGGQTANVVYAGAAGEYPGLYQINLYVPNVVAGSQEVVVRMANENIASSENATVVIGGSNQGTPITPGLFGLHVSGRVLKGAVPWPSFNFGPLRLHDAGNVRWADLNPAQGQYDFSTLDSYIAGAVAGGKTDLIYTFASTPEWAATDPSTCNNGKCASPPMDLNPDGSGANQIWKDFVTAMAQHYAGEIPGKISNWEIWNEPNARNFWTGTDAQLARMAQDAETIIKSIDPAAVILTPAPAAGGVAPGGVGPGQPQVGSQWMSAYLQNPGAQNADVIAFHGYINLNSQPQPEDVVQGVTGFENTDSSHKPLWNTEGGWGKNNGASPMSSDPDLQAAFVARSHLAQAPMVQRYYWYHYDYPQGQLFDPSSNTLTKAGAAFGVVFNWMTGAAITQPCAAQGNSSVWTCEFVRQNGFQALAVWDSSQTCSNGTCTTSNFTPPSNMIKYSDLDGNTVSIQPGSTVPIGAKPIWLTNQ